MCPAQSWIAQEQIPLNSRASSLPPEWGEGDGRVQGFLPAPYIIGVGDRCFQGVLPR
jgi:hypothetical protein